jgi:hypothetical protein
MSQAEIAVRMGLKQPAIESRRRYIGRHGGCRMGNAIIIARKFPLSDPFDGWPIERRRSYFSVVFIQVGL